MTRHFLITGANRGIGLALTGELLRAGHSVIATARDVGNASELESLCQQFPANLHIETLDVASEESVTALATRLKSRSIDVLINNAGVGGPLDHSLASIDAKLVHETIDVNVLGPARMTRAFAEKLESGTRPIIAHISSFLGSIGQCDSTYKYSYRISKAALNMFNKTLSHELRPKGITCVVIHPGWVQTRMGGSRAPLTADVAAKGIANVLDALTIEKTGRFFNYDGAEIPW